MLTLARLVREKVIITVTGKEIVVTVIEAAGGKCRLGFTADQDVIIDREEIHRAKKEERS